MIFNETSVSTDDDQIVVRVIRINEEWMMAKMVIQI